MRRRASATLRLLSSTLPPRERGKFSEDSLIHLDAHNRVFVMLTRDSHVRGQICNDPAYLPLNCIYVFAAARSLIAGIALRHADSRASRGPRLARGAGSQIGNSKQIIAGHPNDAITVARVAIIAHSPASRLRRRRQALLDRKSFAPELICCLWPCVI